MYSEFLKPRGNNTSSRTALVLLWFEVHLHTLIGGELDEPWRTSSAHLNFSRTVWSLHQCPLPPVTKSYVRPGTRKFSRKIKILCPVAWADHKFEDLINSSKVFFIGKNLLRCAAESHHRKRRQKYADRCYSRHQSRPWRH